jgi:hypothetical protein
VIIVIDAGPGVYLKLFFVYLFGFIMSKIGRSKANRNLLMSVIAGKSGLAHAQINRFLIFMLET